MNVLNITLSISLVLVLMCLNGQAQNPIVKIIQNIWSTEIILSASITFSPDQSISHYTDGSGIHDNIHDNSGILFLKGINQ